MAWTRTERVLVVTCIVLMLATVFLAYSVLDTAVSLAYARDEQQYRHIQANLLRKLLSDTGKHWTRTELTQMLQERYGKDHIVAQEGEILSVDDVRFVFEGQNLKEVRFLNKFQEED